MKKLVTILSVILLLASISSLTVFAASNSITDVVGTKTHREIEVSSSGYYSNCEYDWGTSRPNDDAYMSVAAKSPKGRTASAYANLCYHKLQDVNTKSGCQGKKYKYVAEIGGVDRCTYARGIAKSTAGTADLKVK